MDEPFGALDAQTRVVMQEELIKLSRVSPRTVLFITHAVEEAIYLADRVVVMPARPGRTAETTDAAGSRRGRSLRRQGLRRVCLRVRGLGCSIIGANKAPVTYDAETQRRSHPEQLEFIHNLHPHSD